MIVFVYLCLLFNLFFPGKTLVVAELLSIPLQENCFKIFAGDSSGAQLRQALLCGKKITEPESTRALSRWGLLHLVVVSGSHLIFLQSFLKRIRTPPWVLLTILTAFSLLTGFQPPVVRSLASFVLNKITRHNHGLWSGLLCLALFPQWITSISFWLSSLAALLCEWPLSQNLQRYTALMQNFYRQIFIFTLMSPVCYFMAPPLPLAIFSNFIFSYLLGAIWIPLALLPPSEPLFSFLLQQASEMDLPSAGTSNPPAFLFIYVLALYTLLLSYRFYKKERQKRKCYLYLLE